MQKTAEHLYRQTSKTQDSTDECTRHHQRNAVAGQGIILSLAHAAVEDRANKGVNRAGMQQMGNTADSIYST